MRRANGGRNGLWSLWLRWRSQQRVTAGRLLYGAVLPAWQGCGIGRLLWQQVLVTGGQQQWQTVTVGPLWPDLPGVQFLQRRGAQQQQRYVTYSSER